MIKNIKIQTFTQKYKYFSSFQMFGYCKLKFDFTINDINNTARK